ncbi:NADH dehydrogenase (quinone) subunit D [candidate division KSB1 bacterium]
MEESQTKKENQLDPSLDTDTVTLNMGPQHPATHGTLRLELVLDGETVVKATPHVGYLHTGFEKLAETLTYNQFITLSDRMNYLSPLNNNIGFAIAAEKLFDIKVTKKCEYVRVLLAELSRISDHLVSIGTAALDIGAFTAFLYFFEQREVLYDMFQVGCGTRLTTSFTRVGGMMKELPDEFFPMARDFIKSFPKVFKEVDSLLSRNKIWIGRTRGVGVIDGEDAINYGLSGPSLRGSGVPWDIRKNEPYSSYDDFEFDIPVAEKGDCYDRYWVRMIELNESLKIVEQALENMPEGSVNIDDPKTILPDKEDVYNNMEELIHHFMITMEHKGIKPPSGEIYSATEVPNGELGFFIVSDGTNRPYRLRVRPPSLINYQAFPKLLEGGMLSDSVAVLGSLNIIAGELDR